MIRKLFNFCFVLVISFLSAFVLLELLEMPYPKYFAEYGSTQEQFFLVLLGTGEAVSLQDGKNYFEQKKDLQDLLKSFDFQKCSTLSTGGMECINRLNSNYLYNSSINYK